MIKLTKSGNNEPVYISSEHVVSVEMVDEVTMINLRSDRIFVTETPEEVAKLVVTYGLAKQRYIAAYSQLISDPNVEHHNAEMYLMP